ncbi:MAG TPA: hypothetical protein VI160_04410 [Gemmatimonadales bacterium]
MTRLLLFVYAIMLGGLVIAGLVGVGHGRPEGWLYLLGAAVVVGLIVQAWRRLAADVRRRAGAKPLNDNGGGR